jgi:hypothetical protein
MVVPVPNDPAHVTVAPFESVDCDSEMPLLAASTSCPPVTPVLPAVFPAVETPAEKTVFTD